MTSEPTLIDGLIRGSANSCRDNCCSVIRDLINECCGIDGQGKEDELKEEKDPPNKNRALEVGVMLC